MRDDLGSLLIAAGEATPDAVRDAAERQQRTHSRLGTELLGGFDVTPAALAAALVEQAKLRGERPDYLEIMRTISSRLSLVHYRLSEQVADARVALGG